MSLSEQLQRVDGGQIAALKALIQKYGGTVPEGTKIDGYANIINGLGIYSQQEMLSDTTKTALGLESDAVPDDAFMVASKVLQAGNCKIEYGSYTGTGDYGSAHKNSLTFSGQPLIVLIGEKFGGGFLALVRGTLSSTFSSASADRVGNVTTQWDTTNTVTWFSNSSAILQANEQRNQYYYIALLAADT